MKKIITVLGARTINEPAPGAGMEGMYGDWRAAHMIARIRAEG